MTSSFQGTFLASLHVDGGELVRRAAEAVGRVLVFRLVAKVWQPLPP